jgi:hypothetical protein
VAADLGTYPSWLGIVRAAAPDGTEPGRDGPAPAWLVDIGARLGPFTRTKRLRMVRTVHDPAAGEIHFERAEHDTRPHSPWQLTFSTSPAVVENRVGVGVRLHYGGGLAVPGLDRVLAQEVRRALPRLERLARAHPREAD